MCCDAPAAPQTDPRQIDALLKQTDIADKMANHTIDSDKWNQERLNRLDEQQKPLFEQYLRNQQKMETRADESYQFYMDNGRPMINKMLSDANNYDSEDNLNKVRAQASADVEQAFSDQRAATDRNMTRMGINPNSGRFAAAQGDMDANQALSRVSAGNNMAENRRMQGIGLRQQASNVVNGMPATSMNQSASGMNMGNAAIAGGNSSFSNGLNMQQAFSNGMGAAGGMYGNVSAGYGNIFNQRMASANYDAQNSFGAGLGSLMGMGLQAWGISRMKKPGE
ncbi:hypothetical protein [Undibacterium griseum]|uniref:Uncharacterized protein n=1 Tax=Undibacterium griseum TaxID=2762295 RepID=A0ABR6YQY0_9BURK|nr:hypothetical protein [Undibacterium griseum]MBC3886321.1 hypothetical protein [Undibacterium griseum]